MTQTHTPGPWHVVPDEGIPGHREPDRVKIGLYDYAVGPSANARLIAAAPDLLEALIAIIEHDGFERKYLSADLNAKLSKADAAIAKARGVQS